MSSVKSTLHPACFAARMMRASQKGKVVKAVQVDGCQNVRDFWRGYVELAQEFYFAASDCCVDAEFPGDGDEIFLEHLQRHDTGSRAPVLCY